MIGPQSCQTCRVVTAPISYPDGRTYLKFRRQHHDATKVCRIPAARTRLYDHGDE